MLTNAESKLISLIKNIDNDTYFIIGAFLLAKEHNMTEELIEFIEENPDVTQDDIINFSLPNDCFEDT